LDPWALIKSNLGDVVGWANMMCMVYYRNHNVVEAPIDHVVQALLHGLLTSGRWFVL
jgi:hypothetical protein